MKYVSIEFITHEIRKASPYRKLVLIGIDGFGGSGKSSFAEKLKAKLGKASVINIDDFLIKEKISDADKSNFDRARLEQQVLIPVKNGQAAAYQKLDWLTNSLSQPIAIPSVNYLIIEGVSSYDQSIEKYYDYKIWIQTPKKLAEQ